jgi:hypothetical protein
MPTTASRAASVSSEGLSQEPEASSEPVALRRAPVLRQGSSNNSLLIGDALPPDLPQEDDDDAHESASLIGGDNATRPRLGMMQRRWRVARKLETEQAMAAAQVQRKSRGRRRGGGGDDDDDGDTRSILDDLASACACCVLIAGALLWFVGVIGGMMYGLMWANNVTTVQMMDDFHRVRAANLAHNAALQARAAAPAPP